MQESSSRGAFAGARPCLKRTNTSPGTTCFPLESGKATERKSSRAAGGGLAPAGPAIPARRHKAKRATTGFVSARKDDLHGGFVLNIGAKGPEDEEAG